MSSATITCPLCEGEGVAPSLDADDFTLNEECLLCGGTGYVDVELEEE